MFSLDDTTAFVTGGGGGLGAAICEALAAQGARVAVADRALQPAEEVAGRIQAAHGAGAALPVAVEVTDEASVTDAIATVGEQLGPIDTMVTCAGIGHLVPFEQMTFADWRKMVAIHLDGTFLCVRHSLPAMLARGRGRVICISSVAAAQGVAYEVHYSAAKSGIDGLVRALARETARRGVTVNAIAPGYIDTPLNDLIPPAAMAALERNIPMGRLGKPAEIGGLAAYLASDEAAYITGQVVTMNGAFSYGDADQDPELAAEIAAGLE